MVLSFRGAWKHMLYKKVFLIVWICSSSRLFWCLFQGATIRSNPCYTTKPEENHKSNASSRYRDPKSQHNNCDASPLTTLHRVNRKIAPTHLNKDRSVDSESQEEEHNFSDLLNLSVCVPSTPAHVVHAGALHTQQSYSVANSMTSSDISSLANLGTPDSPPRATSPTAEMRELLDKIQQLPQHKSKQETFYCTLHPLSSGSMHIFIHIPTKW